MDKENKIGNSAIEQALMSIIDPFVSGIADGVDNVIQENEKLKAENARYREALEFYADRDSWSFLEEDQSVLIISKCDSEIIIINNHGDKYQFGGRRAREALKEIGE